MNKTRYITEAAVIAAMYAALTLLLAPLSFSQVQVRVSEALTILPFFTPAAVPGLFIGCIVANFFGSTFGWIDVVFGSAATLMAAVLSRKMPKPYLVPLPPVIVNAVVVGALISYGAPATFLVNMLWVGIGQLIACYGVGYPLLLQLNKVKDRVFKRNTEKNA